MRIPSWALMTGLAAPLFFLLLGCLWIDRPGPQYDEALFVNGLQPDRPGAVASWIEINGRPVPLMLMSYVGALKSWLYAALLKTFPPSMATLRLPPILLGAMSIVCTFFFARRIMGGGPAVLAVWLTATDPSYLFTSRMDWGPVAIQHVCLMLGCYLGVRWMESRRWKTLAAASLVFGVGLFDKVSFHWLLVALGLSLLILFPRQVLTELQTRALPVATAFFLLGCSPYLLYCLQPDTPKTEIEIETAAPEYQMKYWMLWRALNGTAMNGLLTPLEAPAPAQPSGVLEKLAYWFTEPWVRPTWLIPALFVSILLLPATLRTGLRNALLFSLLVSLFALAQMAPISSVGAVHHTVLVFPFPQLFLGGTLAALIERFSRQSSRRWLTAAVAAVGLFLVASNVASVMHQYGQILHFGGSPYWTEAVYNLSDDLRKESPPATYVIDWGIETQLRFLSRSELVLVGVPEPSTEAAQLIQDGLRTQGNLFVTYASAESIDYPGTQVFFKEAVTRAGYRLEVKNTVMDYHGRHRYTVYEAHPSSSEDAVEGPKRR